MQSGGGAGWSSADEHDRQIIECLRGSHALGSPKTAGSSIRVQVNPLKPLSAQGSDVMRPSALLPGV